MLKSLKRFGFFLIFSGLLISILTAYALIKFMNVVNALLQ